MYLAHVPPAGFLHYGLDKTGGRLRCFVLVCFVHVCGCVGACVASHGPWAKKTPCSLIRRKKPFLRKEVSPIGAMPIGRQGVKPKCWKGGGRRTCSLYCCI